MRPLLLLCVAFFLCLAAQAEAATLYIADDDAGAKLPGSDSESFGGIFRLALGGSPQLFMAGAFADPEGVLASGNSLFVADRGFPGGRDGRVLRVDLRSGAVRVLARAMSDPRGLAMARGRLYVSDRCRRAIYAVNPTTGRYRTLTRRGLLRRPLGIARHPNGRLYVADYDTASVIAVDASGRQRRVVRGGRLRTPLGVALLGRRLFVIDSNGSDSGGVLEVGRASQRLLAQVENPEGVIAAGGRLLVADDRSQQARILSVDPNSGALTTVAEHHGLADPEGLSWGQDPGVAMAQPAPPSTVPPAPTWPAHCGPLR